jgi:hypothetical protein
MGYLEVHERVGNVWQGKGVVMTSPGSMGQQAAQQAAASASRGAQQHASASYQHTVRHASNAVHRQQHYRGGRRFGLLGRLVSLVFTLVIIAVAVGIVLLVLGQAQPDWFDSALTWFERTF